MATETDGPVEALSLRREARLLLHAHDGAAVPFAFTPRAYHGGYTLYTWGEIRADLLVHLVGLAAALAYAPFLLVAASGHGPGTVLVVLFYLFGLFGMLGVSMAYNFWPIRPEKRLLGKLDLVLIYVKILSVYAVFTWMGTTGPWGPWLYLLAAALAVLGIVQVLTDAPVGDAVRVGIYLAIGWSGAASALHVWQALPADTFALVVAGGLLYTSGVVFYRAAPSGRTATRA